MRTLALSMALISIGGAAHAQDTCVKIDNDLDRLGCYDRTSGRTGKVETITSPGKWSSASEASKLTDDNTITLTLDSNEVIDCGWNNGAKITLVVRCQEKKTAVYFVTGCHMASSEYDDYGKIEYRIDAQKARSVDADASTDNKALGLWSGASAIPLIKQMTSGRQMVTRMTPYSESPFTATFDIVGLDEAIKPLRKECAW